MTHFPSESEQETDTADDSGGAGSDQSTVDGSTNLDFDTDECPGDPEKTQPGVCGCGRPDVDNDGDGALDCVDSCPGDPGKTQPGVCGCGEPDVDQDNDGVFDCADSCPGDPNKTEPGACGCGNADGDGDGDGTHDCSDLCPADPGKIHPGDCGCGVPDVLLNFYPDCDGDGASSQFATVACDLEQANALFDCADKGEPDGGWSDAAGTDCDDEDAGLSDGIAWYSDCDGDGVYSGAVIFACDSVDANVVFDCADGQDPDGGWSGLPGADCNDEDSTGYKESNWYPDCDGDGVYAFVATAACGETGANGVFDCADGKDPDGGWSDVPGTDSNDEDPKIHCPGGEQDNDGDLVCEPAHSLRDALGVPSTVVEFELSSGTYRLYVDGSYDGGGWVLIGRGREDWKWSENGRGKTSAISKGLGTMSAFDPAYLPTSVIREFMSNGGLDLTDVEIRIRRAANSDGSAYQETRWRSRGRKDWTWLLDTQPYDIEYTVFDSVLGPGGSEHAWSTTKHAFVSGDDHTKTFTSPNTNSRSENAFSYGSTVSGTMGILSLGTFLYCNRILGCNQAIPYAEVYIRVAPTM